MRKTSCVKTRSFPNLSVGDIVGNWQVLRIGFYVNYPSSSYIGCLTKCIKCGHRLKQRAARSILIRASQCKMCLRKKSESNSLASRPKIGAEFGTLVVVDNTLWQIQTNGSRFAACAVKCNSCGKSKKVRVTGLKNGDRCRTCNHYCTRAPAPVLKKQLCKGLDLMNLFNKHRSSTSQRNLINWVYNSSRPKHTRLRPVLKVYPDSKIMSFLLPLDQDTPCVWPWDGFGNPLSDAELKKAARKAKLQYKKPLTKPPAIEVTKVNKSTKNKESKQYEQSNY